MFRMKVGFEKMLRLFSAFERDRCITFVLSLYMHAIKEPKSFACMGTLNNWLGIKFQERTEMFH